MSGEVATSPAAPAEEVATSPAAPQSQERGLFTLYGLFDKKKEEPEESHDQPAANAETPTSEHHPTDPPRADTETQVEEGRHGDEITPHTDTQTESAHLYPTDSPDAAPAVVEEDKGGNPTHPRYDDDDAPAVEEDKHDDQIVPPATTHADTQTQLADPYTTDPPRTAAAAENSQAHAYSNEGQHITGEDEKQQTNVSSSSSASFSEEEKDDGKKLQSSDEEEDGEEKKKENVSIGEKLPQKNPYAEPPNEEKKEEIGGYKTEKKEEIGGYKTYENLSPQPNKKESVAEEEKGVRKKRTVKDKIKEKLAGHVPDQNEGEGEEDRKEGLLDKIKHKIPGHHTKE